MKLDKKVAYALIGAGSLTLYGVFNSYTLFFYTDVVKLSARWVGGTWFLFSFWNAINDIASGWISDKSLRKVQKRSNLIKKLVFPVALCFIILWHPLYKSIWYFLAVISVFDFFYSLLTLNYGAMFPKLFRDGRERIRASAINRAVGYGIGGGLTALAPLIYGGFGWSAMGISLAILAVSMYFIGVNEINEEPVKVTETNFLVTKQFQEAIRNMSFIYLMGIGVCLRFVLAVFVSLIPFYTKYVLGLGGGSSSILLLAFIGTSLVGLYYWEKIFRLYGTRKAMLLSLIIAVSFLIPFMFIQNIELSILLLMILGGASGGAMMMGPDLLFADIIDDDHKKTQRRREGVFAGLLGFTFRFPPALVGLILGELLTVARYDANLSVTSQPEKVAHVIKTFFAVGPMIAMIVGIILLCKYPLRGNKQIELLSVKV